MIVLKSHVTHKWMPRIQQIQTIRCQSLRLGPYLPHTPGARMTVVKPTPSNDNQHKAHSNLTSGEQLLDFFKKRKTGPTIQYNAPY